MDKGFDINNDKALSKNTDKKQKTTTKDAPKPERFIYCGPNLPNGVLQRYTVFKGGLPNHLSDVFEKCPAVKRLFVPVPDMAKMDRAIATKGTPEHVYFNEVINTLRGGV